MSCHNLYYFVHLDSAGYPIPGTLFAKNQKASNPCTTHIALVPGTQMTPPAGWKACTSNPSHLRYWYQVTTVIPKGGTPHSAIVPNSMIAVRGVPKGINKHGTGGRPCQYLEWKKFEKI